jgi:hypothetical protein
MNPIKLNVTYYRQWDSATWQGGRMCFSSTCAMLLEYMIPAVLKGGVKQEDDEYLARVNTRGDTTIGWVQEATLKAAGLTSARFRTDLTWADIDASLDAGVPVPVGWLIHGSVNAPSGGGHWSLIVGRTAQGNYLIHDPNGECDLVNGGYKNYTNGKFVEYSKANFSKRWMPGGAKGWGITCEKSQPPKQAVKPTEGVIQAAKVKARIKGVEHPAYIINDRAYVLAAPLGAAWDPKTRIVEIK